MRHVNEEDLVLYHYGEIDAGPVERHLRDCDACRREYDQLRATLGAVDALPVPDRPADYAEQVWQRVQARTADAAVATAAKTATPRVDWLAWLRMPRLAFAGAMAAALVVAFVAGRFAERTTAEPIPETVRERVLLVAVGDHLERSQRLLIELTHAVGDGEVDISSERQMARSLVQTNRLYRQTSTRNGDETIADFLDELERLLIEIANSPDSIDQTELAQLRNRIERQGILFKIRVIGNDAKQRESAAASIPDRI
jgi:hypothetical protein